MPGTGVVLRNGCVGVVYEGVVYEGGRAVVYTNSVGVEEGRRGDEQNMR